jgi:hypothetical protein
MILGLPWQDRLWFPRRIQIRADMFSGDRPACPGGCPGDVHRHGSYLRYAQPSGTRKFAVQRYWCPTCELTISVLPVERLPYRPLEQARLETFFNEQAEIGTGPDPPPAQLEAGCLRRAWTRFKTRVSMLKEAFGLLIASATDSAGALWKQMRLAKATLQGILHYLAQSHKRSLLGDYQCLRLPR